MSEFSSRRRWRLLFPAFVAASVLGASPASAASEQGDFSAPAVVEPEGREVTELATARSRTWVTDEGVHTTRVFSRPINVRGDDGKYEPIDNELRAQDGVFTTGEGSVDLELPRTLADPVKVADGDAWVSLKLRGASAGAAVDGDSATYAGAAPGVDARYTAFNEAVKEDLILKGPDSTTSFSYELRTSAGLSAQARRDGGVDIVGEDGDAAFSIPAAVAIDAKGAVAPEGAATIALDGSSLTVALDPAWVKAQDRAFPVLLDPSVTTSPGQDCFLDQVKPNDNYCGAGEMWVGRGAAGENRVGVSQFDFTGVLPQASFVQQARAFYYPLSQSSQGVAKTIHARRVVADWDNSATWNKRNASTNWATAGGDLATTSEDTQLPPPVGQWSSFRITNLVNSWLDGSMRNQGLALTDMGSTANNTLKYASADNADSNLWPYLDVEYFPRAGQMDKYTIDKQELTDRSSVGVNVAGGNLMISSKDLNVAARGLPVSVDRFYNSQEVWNGQTGSRGRLSIGRDIALMDCDQLGSKCLIGPTGFRARFPKNPDGSFKTPPNVGNLTLQRATATSGRYTLTDNTSGTKWGFFDNTSSFADEIIDRHGNRIGFEFNGPHGSLSKITDATSRVFTVVADQSTGFITKITAPQTGSEPLVEWTYGYTGDKLTSVTNADEKITTYTYTGDNLTKITDPRGNETLITYDTATYQVGTYPRVTSITRRVDGTAANDVTTTYEYPLVDSRCNKATNSRMDGVVGMTVVTRPGDTAAGDKTTYCWDHGGGVRLARDPLGQRTDTSFSATTGNVDKTTEFAGTGNANAATALTFGDGTGSGAAGVSPYNMIKSVSPAGETSTQTYKAPSASDPLQQYRPDITTDAQGKRTQNTYDNGYLTDVSSLNASGAPVKSVQMTWNDHTTSWPGTLATSTDGEGRQTRYYYDPLGRLSEVLPPNYQVIGRTAYTYDGLSRVKTMTTGLQGLTGTTGGKTTTYTYDRMSRQKTVTDQAGVVHTMFYDGNGNLTGRTGPSQTSSYIYDKLNRRTSETIIGTTNTYAYDKRGNLTSVSDAGAPGPVQYTFDPLNRVKTVKSPPATGSTPDITTYDYVPPVGASSGNPATPPSVLQTLPGGGTIRTTKDLSGKTTALQVKDNTGTQRLQRLYIYTSVNYGTSGAQHEVVDEIMEKGLTTDPWTYRGFSYDLSGQLVYANTLDGDQTLVTQDQFTIDKAGNRTRRERYANGATTNTYYAYNANNQLCWTSTTQPATGCDNTAAPGANVPAGGSPYTYDANGNQLSGAGASAMTWNAKDMLATLGGQTVTTLSPNNNELAAIGTSVFKNTLLGVSRITVGGNTSIIHRNPDTGAAVSQNRDSQKRWFVTDHLGSTIALIEGNGNIARTYSYDTDGNVTNGAINGPDTWIKYAGGHDIGSGLYHYGARYYQPSIGRWTQQDSLLQPDDLGQSNRYVYVGNNAINYIDPDGLFLKKLGKIAKDFAKGAACAGVGLGGGLLGFGAGSALGGPVGGGVGAITVGGGAAYACEENL